MTNPPITEMKTAASQANLTLPIFLAAAALSLFAACAKKRPPPPAPPVVQVVEVTEQDVPIYHEWIGTLDGLVNAQIRAQITGYLLSQNFREGDPVKTNDLLFQIDQRPFLAELEQAKGRLAQAERNTRGMLNGMLSSLGFRRITVNFASPAPAGR